MTVSPLGPSPFPPPLPPLDRPATKTPDAVQAPGASGPAAVTDSTTGELQDLLQAILDRGFSIEPLNEDSARLTAESVKSALGSQDQPIANADPAAIGKRF